MTTELLEARIAQLEDRVKDVERSINNPPNDRSLPSNRGCRAFVFVGVDTNNPDFEDAVRFGREWRFADNPDDSSETR